ncbi:hypothetical protein GOP47_0006175 [Adiantum capillus-veneris]|uniref:Uncharacterized protein n=1 Tax=Adiantum capillus-veneris TaxID=13818 RepID=A0A9D4ZK55_ADICA|nr:hypothetical protein GOP47_0006175 [Adiantum capillus-veneris]
MVREVVLHRAAEKARDADTLGKRAVERVPVSDDLEEGFTFWLLDTLRVKHAVKKVFVEFHGLGTWLPLSEVEPLSLTWPEVVHVIITDEPGGLSKKQWIEVDELSTTEKAFNLEFQNPDNVSTMHQALSCIMRGYGYAPTAGLFQSSGWGKSRVVCELWKKDVWVVYCSFAAGTGYPKISPIAKWFHQQAMKHLGSDASLRGQLACMNFTLAYFCACLCVLENKVKNSDWNREKFLIETRQRNNYWEDVQEQTEKFLAVRSLKDEWQRVAFNATIRAHAHSKGISQSPKRSMIDISESSTSSPWKSQRKQLVVEAKVDSNTHPRAYTQSK